MVRQRGSALRLLSLVRPSRCELLLVRSLSFFKKKSQMVRRDFSRSVPETFAMVDGRMVDGHADGRGWRRDRAPRTERRCGVDGRRGRVGVGRGWHSSIDDAQCRPARAVSLRDTLPPILGTVALATARPRGGTAAMTHTAGRMSRSPRPVRGVLGGITGRAVDGPRARKGGVAGASGGCGVASWSRSARQSRKRCQSERKIKRRLACT